MLIITGIVSDRFRVRKPFMVVGGIGAIVMTIVFLNQGATTSYSTIVVIISVLAAFLAIAYAPWMASFTETVEKHNPALIATGLAVWGWIIRVVVALSALFVPIVVSSITPVITTGAQVQAYATQYASQVAFATAHPDVRRRRAEGPGQRDRHRAVHPGQRDHRRERDPAVGAGHRPGGPEPSWRTR